MNVSLAIAPVRKNIRVNAPIEHTFKTFTDGLARWWPPNYGIGKKPIVNVLLEPRVGGHWVEVCEDGTRTNIATVTVWDPPHRFVMLWNVSAQWKPDADMKSEVDFIADGPDATNVELVHHKFEAMGAEPGASMRKDVDGGWPKHLASFAAEAERSKP